MPSFLDLNRSPSLLENPRFEGIAPGGRATARIPVGATLLNAFLRFSIAGVAATPAQIAAQVTRIRLIVDANILIDASGSNLVDIANFYRPNAVANGILPLYMARDWMQEIQAQDGPAYGLGDAASANIEVQFAAGSTIDAISYRNETVAGEPLGAHTVTLSQQYNYTAAGLIEIADIPRNPNYGLFAMHLFTPKANITNIQIVADNALLLDAAPSEIEARYNLFVGSRTPQANALALDFTYRNRAADILPLTMQDMRLRINFTVAPGNFPIVYEQARVAPVKGS